jgi:hypothetical protein
MLREREGFGAEWHLHLPSNVIRFTDNDSVT